MFGVYFGELIIQALPAAVLAYGFALLIYRLKDGQIPEIPKASHAFGCAVALLGGALFRIVAMNTSAGVGALFLKTNEAMAFYLLIVPACVAVIYLHFAKKSASKFAEETLPSVTETSIDDQVFLRVARELAANQKDEALWMKAFALENGDTAKTKAHYVRLRVEKLQGAAQRPPLSQQQQPSATVSKSILALPNLLIGALYVVSVFAMSSKYGFSMTAFARSLGVCAIPALVAFAWTMRRDDAQRLKTASYVVTGLFFAIAIMSQLQVAKEKAAQASVASPVAPTEQRSSPPVDWSQFTPAGTEKKTGAFDDLRPAGTEKKTGAFDDLIDQARIMRDAGVGGTQSEPDVRAWGEGRLVALLRKLDDYPKAMNGVENWRYLLVSKAGWPDGYALFLGFMYQIADINDGKICRPDLSRHDGLLVKGQGKGFTLFRECYELTP